MWEQTELGCRRAAQFCRSSRTSAGSGAQNNKDSNWGVTESVMRVRGDFFLNRKMKDRVEAVGFVFLYEPLSRLWRVQETRTKGRGNEKRKRSTDWLRPRGAGGQAWKRGLEAAAGSWLRSVGGVDGGGVEIFLKPILRLNDFLGNIFAL